jgi:hypothetical protein
MRKEIWKVLKDLEKEKVTTNEAYHLLCDLYNVVQQSEQFKDFLTWLEKEGYNCDFEWDDSTIEDYLKSL